MEYRSFFVAAMLATGCVDRGGTGGQAESDATGGEGTGGETSPGVSTAAATQPGTTSEAESDSGPSVTTATSVTSVTTDTSGVDSSDSSDGGGDFIRIPDGGSPPYECDMWEQNCPDGEKCNPWANDGGSVLNATRCVEIVRDPVAHGEPCDDSESLDGYDDCGLGSLCWGETCTAWCTGSEVNPSCAAPCERCTIGGGLLALCLASCDPFAQDCAPGEACYPVNDDFACLSDVSDELGVAGDGCEWLNDCDPGFFCLTAELWPDCEDASCCVPVCDLGAADPCPGAPPGVGCTAWYEEGHAPPDDGCVPYDTIGVCVLPPA